jgi:16S rRNA (adenine1518-N6/adenine1519-N6)-dimethyltransferase
MRRKFHSPNRPKLGQHFLIDTLVRERLVASLRLQPTDTVVEIGAGRGFLTEALAPRVKKLWAVELDPRWALTLKAAFINSPTVEVVRQDVLKADFHRFLDPADEGGPLRIVGNLPYYISSPILFHLFNHAAVIRDATLMVQREVAERLTATPTSRSYGYASLVTQLFTQPTVLFSVSPKAFSPPPRIQSAVVHLHMSPRTAALQLDDVPAFLKFAQQIFLEKRKTLLNNLRRLIHDRSEDASSRLQSVMAECALQSTVRAENISLESTAQLYRNLRRHALL